MNSANPNPRPRRGPSEADAAGCLVILGLLALIGALLVGAWITSANLNELLFYLDGTSVVAFFKSLWAWLRSGGHHGISSTIVAVYFLGYCGLLWQWVVFLIGRRTLVASRRLWIISSAYFGLLIVTSAVAIWNASDSLFACLFGIVWASVIPLFFLRVTLLLWWLSPPRKQ